MKQIFDQFLQFLQQGIAAIFRFVELVWAWSIDQITRATEAPWQNWPLWKQVLLVIVIAAVAYALFIAASRLWFAGVRVLAAFASFLGALVVTLPAILAAGVIALAGLWLVNNLKLPALDNITLIHSDDNAPASKGDKSTSPTTTGQGGETTGNKQ